MAQVVIGMSGVREIDKWLDENTGERYQQQPLAQDWGRVAKVTEEAGEAIDALIGLTSQNPRKGEYATYVDLYNELADVAWTAIFAIQHFTKSETGTARILNEKREAILNRIPEDCRP